jgi:hypothetical protein
MGHLYDRLIAGICAAQEFKMSRFGLKVLMSDYLARKHSKRLDLIEISFFAHR